MVGKGGRGQGQECRGDTWKIETRGVLGPTKVPTGLPTCPGRAPTPTQTHHHTSTQTLRLWTCISTQKLGAGAEGRWTVPTGPHSPPCSASPARPPPPPPGTCGLQVLSRGEEVGRQAALPPSLPAGAGAWCECQTGKLRPRGHRDMHTTPTVKQRNGVCRPRTLLGSNASRERPEDAAPGKSSQTQGAAGGGSWTARPGPHFLAQSARTTPLWPSSTTVWGPQPMLLPHHQRNGCCPGGNGDTHAVHTGHETALLSPTGRSSSRSCGSSEGEGAAQHHAEGPRLGAAPHPVTAKCPPSLGLSFPI